MNHTFPDILFQNPEPLIQKGVFLLETELLQGEFEPVYLRIRRKEGQLLNDEQVLKLPFWETGGELNRLWTLRRKSTNAVSNHISTQKDPIILDLGCGNGWFANQLAEIPGSRVLGLDLNRTELEQAARLFNKPNLAFAFGNVESAPLIPGSFDFIVLNASVQYFENLPDLLRKLHALLSPNGEIHILDSPFYKDPASRERARERSIHHFKSMGEPEMAPFYHHFLLSELESFRPELHYFNRNLLFKLLRIPQNPMPWIILRKPS